jgi:hypothetical protein
MSMPGISGGKNNGTVVLRMKFNKTEKQDFAITLKAKVNEPTILQ